MVHSFGFQAEDRARRCQSSLINTVTLAFGAGSKPIKIYAACRARGLALSES